MLHEVENSNTTRCNKTKNHYIQNIWKHETEIKINFD